MSRAGRAADVEAELIASWDRQQEVYIPAREARFALMADLLRQVTSATAARVPRVLDLACGPGSASLHAARALGASGVELIAIDVDPVLLELGRRTWPADAPAPRWVNADLSTPDWMRRLPDGGTFDAVISSTALHWLSSRELAQVYAAAHRLLRPGGVLLNGDYAPNPHPVAAADALTRIAALREQRAVAAGASTWEGWWRKVGESGAFDSELAERERIFAGRERGAAPTREEHLAALRDAGFTAPHVIWQDLDEVLLVAVREP